MLLEAKGISVKRRGTFILDNAGLNLSERELCMIIGPNGAGKTTLLNILADEVSDFSKNIFFKEKAFAQWDKLLLARQKAKFSQENRSEISLTTEEVVLMGRYPYFSSLPSNTDIEMVHKAMTTTEIFGLKDRNYNSLSGGEKQRVHLARIIAQLENEVLAKLAFFDEPLNNLDIRHQYRILNSIQSFVSKGNSAVLIIHDLNLAAEYADKIILLKEGRILAKGSPDEVFRPEIISEAYDCPCRIDKNPLTSSPMILFDKSRLKEQKKKAYSDDFQAIY